MTTALSKIESHSCKTVDEVRVAVEGFRGKANVMMPAVAIESIPWGHQISLRAVQIDSAVDAMGAGDDCYLDKRFCKANERAINRRGLAKLMAAAGVIKEFSRRVDDREDPFYCEYEVGISMKDYDGTIRKIVSTKVLDLRAGAPESMKKGDEALSLSALADKRRHMGALCETKALNRALRELLQLKQKYTVAELAKPFVVPKLVAALDPSDPDAKRALIAQAMGVQHLLYAAAPTDQQVETMLLHEGAKRVVADDEPPPEAVDPATGEVVSEDDFPALAGADFRSPPPEGDEERIYICGCTCGHQVEISKQVASMTIDRAGSQRCGECYPGKQFNFETHDDDLDLALPKFPGITPAKIRARVSP